MATGTFTYNALRTKTLKERMKAQRKIVSHSNSTIVWNVGQSYETLVNRMKRQFFYVFIVLQIKSRNISPRGPLSINPAVSWGLPTTSYFIISYYIQYTCVIFKSVNRCNFQWIYMVVNK